MFKLSFANGETSLRLNDDPVNGAHMEVRFTDLYPWVLALRDRHGSLEATALGPLMDEARRRFGDERVEQIAA